MKRCFSCFKLFDEEYSVCPHCGQDEITSPDQPIHLHPGTVLAERYIIGHSLGAGGFGIVYNAWDAKLETIVAIKEFFVTRFMTRAAGDTDVIVTKKAYNEYEYRKARFLAEARNMAKFGSHKSIPNVFEFFEENETAYIVMELLHGVSLKDYILETEGKVDVAFAKMVATEVGNALKSLHKENIIHRDVAPDNIFICTKNEIRVKLMDLGAAKLADNTDDVIDIVLKPGFAPPEQYEKNKDVSPAMDIYALGATLYVMLTGKKPDESTNRKDRIENNEEDSVIPPALINENVDENLSNTVMKALALEPHMRFKNIDEFLRALNGEKKVLPIEKEKKRRRFRRFSQIISACLVVAIVASLVFFFYGSKKAVQYLDAADISVWFSVSDNSSEADAMQEIADDFTSKFNNINIDLQAIPESEYMATLSAAAAEGNLPTLFESTGADEEILAKAGDVSNILKSDQAVECLFINQYNNYYTDTKQIPLAIEVPVAYVITNGAVFLHYDGHYFSSPDDFGANVNIALDERYESLICANNLGGNFCVQEEFLNNELNTSPVLLSSTMIMNEVRTTLVNYEKTCVFYNSDEINCRFVYEWSIGNGNKAEIAAAERMLTWMLGSGYQNTLMISKCNDGEIPINKKCFISKIQTKNLAPLEEIYFKFVFDKEDY